MYYEYRYVMCTRIRVSLHYSKIYEYTSMSKLKLFSFT